MSDKRRDKQKLPPGLVPGVNYGRGSMGRSNSVLTESIPIAKWLTPARMNGLANWLFVICALLAFYAAFQWISRSTVFGLRQVVVSSPLKQVDIAVLRGAMRSLRGDLFSIDLESARVSIAKLSWVRNVNIRRAFPDRLDIAIEEHEPLGRWGEDTLINSYGEIFEADYRADLPKFAGPSGSEREVVDFYKRSKSALAVLGLAPAAVSLSPRRAWRVKLDNGLVLELGREQIDDRLAVFARAYPSALAQLSGNEGTIDLRYDGGFVLKTGLGKELLKKDREQGHKG
jgi:cell division protein FtsQ